MTQTQAPARTFYAAPHKNQTIVFKMDDALVAQLREWDNVDAMDAHYLAKYNAGNFGNKRFIENIQASLDAGITEIEVKVQDVDPEERVNAAGQRFMVLADDAEIEFVDPWKDGTYKYGIIMYPPYFNLDIVEGIVFEPHDERDND